MRSVLFCCLVLVGNAVFAYDWSKARVPSQGEAQSIGTYTAGCLAGGAQLPRDGVGYHVMRLSRQRDYGHPLLIGFIEELARQTSAGQGLELLVGDLGQARGGPTPSGHRSHQTGLDVDIWFGQVPLGSALSNADRERLSATNVVRRDGMAVNPSQWNNAQAAILRMASAEPNVERIFVNAAIKKQLCETERDHAWLQKIRPWWGHEEHFHVRLRCPPDSPHCQKQEPVPAGDGCDAGLDWWFSAEARQRGKPTPRVAPLLPLSCDAVFAAPARD